MEIIIRVEPSTYAREKGLRKGQRHLVVMRNRGDNKNFPGQWFYSVQPPNGKTLYAFYDSEVDLIHR